MPHGSASQRASTRPGERGVRAHELLRLLAVVVVIGALGYSCFEGLAFTEQLLRLAAGALR